MKCSIRRTYSCKYLRSVYVALHFPQESRRRPDRPKHGTGRMEEGRKNAHIDKNTMYVVLGTQCINFAMTQRGSGSVLCYSRVEVLLPETQNGILCHSTILYTV